MIQGVNANVVLLHSPKNDEHLFSAKAARFCTEGSSIADIMKTSTNDERILNNVIDYGHLSVLRFDWYIFGIENISRTCSHQLVRKTSGVCFAQESMRYTSQDGDYKIIVPDSLKQKITVPISIDECTFEIDIYELAEICHQFYNGLQKKGIPNEDARFALLEASKTKIMFGLNSQALLDFFGERCCRTAQWEIRHVANKMLSLCKEDNHNVFKNAGPKCLKSGFCRESKAKWEQCKFKPHKSTVFEKKEVIDALTQLINTLKGE